MAQVSAVGSDPADEPADDLYQAGMEDHIRAEVEDFDIGGYGDSHYEKILGKITCARARLMDELKRVQDWAETRERQLKGRLAMIDRIFYSEAQEAVQALLAKRKGKSIKTPWGQAGFRATPTRIEVRDEERLLAHATAHLPQLVKVTRVVPKSAVNEHFKTTGEELPGVELIPAGEVFYVR